MILVYIGATDTKEIHRGYVNRPTGQQIRKPRGAGARTGHGSVCGGPRRHRRPYLLAVGARRPERVAWGAAMSEFNNVLIRVSLVVALVAEFLVGVLS